MIRYKDLKQSYSKFGYYALMGIAIVLVVMSISNIDPLNFGRFNSIKMYRLENGNRIDMFIKDEMENYISKEGWWSTQEKINNEFENNYVKIEGYGRVEKIKELNYNYEVIMEYYDETIYLRIPYNYNQDEIISKLNKNDKVKFTGYFHCFENTKKSNGLYTHRLILKSCKILEDK